MLMRSPRVSQLPSGSSMDNYASNSAQSRQFTKADDDVPNATESNSNKSSKGDDGGARRSQRGPGEGI
jgi:hypothetical protein